MPLFSICIPNYNYEAYLGETLDSVLAQRFEDFEIVVADNASTDSSMQILRDYAAKDSRLEFKQNACNVGFAGNLPKSAELARGEWFTMLSSDDLTHPDMLNDYKLVIDHYGEKAEEVIISSTQDVIDGESKKTGATGVQWHIWKGAVKNEQLSVEIGANVWEIDAHTLLANSLGLMRNPFTFASTTYSKKLYDAVEGYSQTSIINPDKKFAYEILARAKKAVVIEKPLILYRVHANNQGSQLAKSGALKYTTDQYIFTFQPSKEVLSSSGYSQEMLAKSFLKNDIVEKGFKELSEGNILKARRMYRYGRAVYPQYIGTTKNAMPFRFLLALGPLGVFVAKKLRASIESKWRDNNQGE